MSIDQQNDGNNNDSTKRLSPLDTLPKVVSQVVINLHNGGRVTGNIPTDMKVVMYMLGEFFKQIGPLLTYSQPSPIVAPPPGIVLPKGGK